jgi:hypothetical protein
VWFLLGPIRVMASFKNDAVCNWLCSLHIYIGSSYRLPMVLKGSYTHRDKARGLLFWLTVVSFQGFVIDMMKVVYNRACFEVCFMF